MHKVTLSIDAGGTYYKAAIVDSFGTIIPGTWIEVPSFSDASQEKILTTFSQMITSMIALADGMTITRIALSFPGPFDYRRGACMMKHKFSSIYNLSLFSVIRDIVQDDSVEIVFHHDLHACTYGAYLYDVAQGYSRVFCVAIGTGLGTGCLHDGKIQFRADGGPRYPIFQKPCKEGILEDIVSNRGLVSAYTTLSSSNPPRDAKEIEKRGERGDEVALQVYRNMGRVLGEELLPLLSQLQSECVVLGGQIAKGFHLFGPPLLQALKPLETIQRIAPISDITTVTIRGCAALPLREE